MTNEEVVALAFAKVRTGGSVYMDGSHNPRMTEKFAARRLCEDLGLDPDQERA